MKLFDGHEVIEVAFDNDRVLLHPYIADSEYNAGEHEPFSWSVSDYGVHLMQMSTDEDPVSALQAALGRRTH